MNLFHSHLWSRAFTLPKVTINPLNGRKREGPARCYKVCLDCGAEEELDWQALGSLEPAVERKFQAEKETA